MKERKLLSLLGLMPLVACQTTERPNILFILADDHSTAAISAYGGINSELAPTPNIDGIAQNGVLMDNMICTNSISGPSRASLVTGKISTTNGFYQNEGGIIFDGSQMQYQKLLQQNGYSTALFGKWHLFSTPEGFDTYTIHGDKSQQGQYWDPLYETDGVKHKEKGYTTTLTTNFALEWLDKQQETGKPFAMMLHYKAPHRPWDPDSCYVDLFNDVEFPYPETFNDDYKGREQTLGRNMGTIEFHTSRGDLKQTPPEGLTQKERSEWLWWGGSGKDQYWSPSEDLKGQELKKWKFQNYLKNYLRVVRSVDDNVGRVISYLKENDLYDNTIIVYMGDQGFFLGEHGLYDKRWMYEEAIRMPCLISYPNGIKKSEAIEQIALNIDIAPTLLDFAEVEIPSDMQGVSMRAMLEGDEEAKANWRKSAYYQYFEYPKWHSVQPHYGVRTERYKLMHFYYNIDCWELYDLEKDPKEINNLYGNPDYASITEELKEEIIRLQKHYGDTLTLDARRELTDRYMINY